MKAGEYRSMSVEELENVIEDLRRTLFDRRQELITGELENVNQIKQTKRDLARALTVLGEKTSNNKSAQTA